MTEIRTASLTEEQRRRFHAEGYLLLGKILDDATLDALRAEEARFRGESPATELTVFRNQLCNYSRAVREFCTDGPHVPLMAQLIGPDVALWFNQFVTKRPDGASGKSEFPWHQDNGYAAIEPANNLTIWIALDDVNEENGCVWVQPGSHRLGLLEHKTASAESWHLTVQVEGDGVPARLRAGEAVAFTGLTLHRSKLNKTARLRRAFFAEYVQASATIHRPQQPDAPPRPIIQLPDTWLVAGQLPWTGPKPLGY